MTFYINRHSLFACALYCFCLWTFYQFNYECMNCKFLQICLWSPIHFMSCSFSSRSLVRHLHSVHFHVLLFAICSWIFRTTPYNLVLYFNDLHFSSLPSSLEFWWSVILTSCNFSQPKLRLKSKIKNLVFGDVTVKNSAPSRSFMIYM